MNSTKQSSLKVKQILAAALALRDAVNEIAFEPYIPWVYNPLDYAWPLYQQYIERHFRSSCETIFVGMNPGPWGMSQTGVPFGEVSMVKNWLKVTAEVVGPRKQHPKRPIQGLACLRKEVSGDRFWGFFKEKYKTPAKFFQSHFVASYCPLAFMEQSGLNITPDKLPALVRSPLQQACDQHLMRLLEIVSPKWLIGVGGWAEKRCQSVVENLEVSFVKVGKILHPSPASPAANKNWSEVVEGQLKSLGVWR